MDRKPPRSLMMYSVRIKFVRSAPEAPGGGAKSMGVGRSGHVFLLPPRFRRVSVASPVILSLRVLELFSIVSFYLVETRGFNL